MLLGCDNQEKTQPQAKKHISENFSLKHSANHKEKDSQEKEMDKFKLEKKNNIFPVVSHKTFTNSMFIPFKSQNLNQSNNKMLSLWVKQKIQKQTQPQKHKNKHTKKKHPFKNETDFCLFETIFTKFTDRPSRNIFNNIAQTFTDVLCYYQQLQVFFCVCFFKNKNVCLW